MKILAVLAILISFCVAYKDWSMITCMANSTQAIQPSSSSTGSCMITHSLTSNVFTGTITCTGLSATGNVTAAHLHYVDYGYAISQYTGSPILSCPITVDMTGTGSWNCDFSNDQSTLDLLCNDLIYFNVHTTDFPAGAVRCNMVSMAPYCNYGTVTIDSSVASTTVVPTSGFNQVPDFYVGFPGYSILPAGTGSCYVYISWNSTAQLITFSGCCWGLTSYITEIAAYYPNDIAGSYFLYITGSTVSSGVPFSYTISPGSYPELSLAKIASSTAYIVVYTLNNPTTGEIQINLTATNFPKNAAKCRPVFFSPLKSALTCYVGDTKTNTATACFDTTYYCGDNFLLGTEYKVCIPSQNCFSCDCGATSSDLPSYGYACCNTNYCNLPNLAAFGCLNPPPSSSITIANSLFISLIVLFFMKWFN